MKIFQSIGYSVEFHGVGELKTKELSKGYCS